MRFESAQEVSFRQKVWKRNPHLRVFFLRITHAQIGVWRSPSGLAPLFWRLGVLLSFGGLDGSKLWRRIADRLLVTVSRRRCWQLPVSAFATLRLNPLPLLCSLIVFLFALGTPRSFTVALSFSHSLHPSSSTQPITITMFRFLSGPTATRDEDDKREHEPLVLHSDDREEGEQELSPVLSDTGTAVEGSYQQHAHLSSSNLSHSTSSIRSSPSIRFWALVCVACATLNIVLAILFPTVHLHSPFSVSSSWPWSSSSSQDVAANGQYGLQPMQPFNMKDLSSLRRPSHFIGFEQIDRQAILASLPPTTPQETKRHQFDNYPVVVAQVDGAKGREDESLSVFTKRRMVRVGVVEGTEKWVFVNKTVRILSLGQSFPSHSSTSLVPVVFFVFLLFIRENICPISSSASVFVYVHFLSDSPSLSTFLYHIFRLH